MKIDGRSGRPKEKRSDRFETCCEIKLLASSLMMKIMKGQGFIRDCAEASRKSGDFETFGREKRWRRRGLIIDLSTLLWTVTYLV